ncbi:hypothetical protein [Citrobacter freundii]|uniref:Uncharacterized protein n=1 Tax=Citrobacter freundii TaxID=546 RepID=A0A7G2IPG1_CITFR|nr:hypothetical protein [Citrobacter freundii]
MTSSNAGWRYRLSGQHKTPKPKKRLFFSAITLSSIINS